MVTVTEVDNKIENHIDLCALRYEGIEKEMRGVNARLKRIETLFVTGLGAIFMVLVSLVLKAH